MKKNTNNDFFELAEITKKLEAVSKKQEEYMSQFLYGATNNVTGSSSDEKEYLDELNQAISSLKSTASKLADKIKANKKRLNKLEQYGCSNSLILHGCVNLPDKR